MVMELSPEVKAVAEAIQSYVNAQEEPGLVTQAIVIYEIATMGDDGDTSRQIGYCVPTDNFALSGALGLLCAGMYFVKRDCLGSGADA